MNSATLSTELPTSRPRATTGGNPPEPPNNPQTTVVANLLDKSRRKVLKAKRDEELLKIANAIKETPNPSSVPDSERDRGNKQKGQRRSIPARTRKAETPSQNFQICKKR